MNLCEVKKLGWKLMLKHGLVNWGFMFDNSVVRYGVCKHRAKVISLSRKLCLINDEASVRDTILHEIAHALTPRHGHDSVWKAKCIEIGAKPERCYTSKDTNTLELRYVAICGGCGEKHEKARMVNKNIRRSCKCQSGKDWNKRILLEFIDSKK